jgi:hypothetical protein
VKLASSKADRYYSLHTCNRKRKRIEKSMNKRERKRAIVRKRKGSYRVGRKRRVRSTACGKTNFLLKDI